MIKWIKSFFIKEERNSLTPNSFAVMPDNAFHNYAIEQREHDDCPEPHKNIWGVFHFDVKKYNQIYRKNIFYTLYNQK